MRIALLSLCSLLMTPLALPAQEPAAETATPKSGKLITPEQQAYQLQFKEFQEARHKIQAQAKQAFDAEMALDQSDEAKTGECKDANTTFDWNQCLGRVSKVTEANYAAFTAALRALIALKTPEMEPSVSAGAALSSDERASEFDKLETLWQQYRDLARKAAYDQYKGGSMSPSFALEAYIYSIRSHLRVLDLIYGDDLRQ
jgi:uncharacterized protein YecT (DUF1311 family)